MLKGLNEQQRYVVLDSINNNALVLAGAGSGKTRVLITRIEYLLNQLNVDAGSIMAITFTRKAANELKDRLSSTVDDDELAQMWVGTYHSVCLKIIDAFGENIGIKEGYTILDTYNARKCAGDIMKSMGLEVSKKTVGEYLKRVSRLKNNLIFPKKFREIVVKKYAGKEATSTSESDYIFADFYSKYQQENIKSNVLDFDDIILYSVMLLSSNQETQSFVKYKFKYIMADESQDSNPCNMVLINLLSKYCNLFLVGDEDQAIYGFRGARPDIVMEYATNRKDMKIYKLEQNYRSTQTIVNASNVVISYNDGRMDKTCFSKGEVGEKISLCQCSTNIEEAMYVVKRIKQLLEKGYTYEDIMILYRTNAQSRIFEETFMRANIPYSLVGAVSFNERAEIKDCMSVLRLACNKRDKYSFKRALSTLDGVGAKAVNDLVAIMDTSQDAVEALQSYSPRTKKAKESLSILLSTLNLIDRKPTAVLNKIAEYYISQLTNVGDEKALERIDNIKELQNVVAEKELEGMALQEFVMQMDLMSANDNVADSDTVTMLTIHASKGLESPVVFLVGVNDEILPHGNCYSSPNGMQEERRLLYVGMTRAEKKLYVSTYTDDSRKTYNDSPFIKEIPSSYVEMDYVMF